MTRAPTPALVASLHEYDSVGPEQGAWWDPASKLLALVRTSAGDVAGARRWVVPVIRGPHPQQSGRCRWGRPVGVDTLRRLSAFFGRRRRHATAAGVEGGARMSEATAGNAVGEAVRAGGAAGPLFLVGVPRSGTTLIYKLLCLHPDAAYISNWMRTAPAVPALALANRLTPRFADTRRTTWFGADRANAYVNGEPMAWRKQLFPRPVEGEPFYRSCGIAVPDSAGRPDMGRLQRLPGMLGAVCRYGGGRVFVSKYLANNHHIPALAELFPSARFVSIVRDGRAVACSLSRVHWWPDLTVWWYGGTPGRWQAEGRDPWELCARHWVRELAVLEQGLAAVPAARRLEIRYEALVAEPVATMRQLAAFAGLADRWDWVQELARLRYPNRNERWYSRLDPQVRGRIEAIQGDDLRRLGYLG